MPRISAARKKKLGNFHGAHVVNPNHRRVTRSSTINVVSRNVVVHQSHEAPKNAPKVEQSPFDKKKHAKRMVAAKQLRNKLRKPNRKFLLNLH